MNLSLLGYLVWAQIQKNIGTYYQKRSYKIKPERVGKNGNSNRFGNSKRRIFFDSKLYTFPIDQNHFLRSLSLAADSERMNYFKRKIISKERFGLVYCHFWSLKNGEQIEFFFLQIFNSFLRKMKRQNRPAFGQHMTVET